MTAATAALDVGFAALLAHHGEAATYTPAGGAAVAITAIFDEKTQIIEPQTGIVTTAPTVRTWTSSTPAAKMGDRIARPSTGVTYNVLRVEPDGISSTILILSRDTQIPVAPSGLLGTLPDIFPNLNWTRNATNNTAVEVWRAEGAGAFSRLEVLGAAITTYEDVNVSQLTYRYKIRNTNLSGPSPFSNEVQITVP